MTYWVYYPSPRGLLPHPPNLTSSDRNWDNSMDTHTNVHATICSQLWLILKWCTQRAKLDPPLPRSHHPTYNSTCPLAGLQITSSQAFTSHQTLEMFRLSAVLPWLWLWWKPGVCVLRSHLSSLQGTAVRDKPEGWEGNRRMCLCSGEMPTEKHTSAIPSEPPDLLPNTQLQLSSNLKYKNQPKTRKKPANQTTNEPVFYWNKYFSICTVLQAVLLVHKKHRSTHRQASE